MLIFKHVACFYIILLKTKNSLKSPCSFQILHPTRLYDVCIEEFVNRSLAGCSVLVVFAKGNIIRAMFVYTRQTSNSLSLRLLIINSSEFVT